MNQQEYYDYLAQMGGWKDFAHLWANRDEVQVFSKVLFDFLCANDGHEEPFWNEYEKTTK